MHSNLVMHALAEIKQAWGHTPHLQIDPYEKLDWVEVGEKHAPEGVEPYDYMVTACVMQLMQIFAEQGHSGMSGSMVLQAFTRLADFKALSALTNNPAEWIEVGQGLWQNKRQSDAFSEDNGKTYKLLDDKETVYTSEEYNG